MGDVDDPQPAGRGRGESALHRILRFHPRNIRLCREHTFAAMNPTNPESAYDPTGLIPTEHQPCHQIRACIFRTR